MDWTKWLAGVLVGVLSVAGLLELSARLLQLRARLGACLAPQTAYARHSGGPAFVSVHIAICNEPPRLVIDTLKALAQSRFEAFEVIVVDNNTGDANLWTPVEASVASLGDRFRFIHIDRLAGAKAGALNVALQETDRRATHVAIVDADYQVDPDFLGDGVHSLLSAKVDYVQFPQAYRGVGRAARGVEEELADYFSCFAGGAGLPGSMLPTGTLSLFTLCALLAVGGWPTNTITEDAEIGVRLQAAGYRGLWLARNRGRGLLPVDLAGLRKQRARWAAGNLQVLKGLPAFERLDLSLGNLLNLIVQLTSWVSLILPAALAIVLTAILPGLPLAGLMRELAAATILGSIGVTALRMIVLHDGRAPWAVRSEAFAAKLALTWTSATAWVPALIDRPLVFHRTAKSVSASSTDGARAVWIVSLIFLCAGVIYLVRGNSLACAACLLLASVWLCARRVDANLKRAAALNPELV